MDVDYINPFVSTAFGVLQEIFSSRPDKGQISMCPTTVTSHPCNVVFEVSGDIRGSIVYGMSLLTADKIATVMTGSPIRTFDQQAATAIGELGNILSSTAVTELLRRKCTCNLVGPMIIRGKNIPTYARNIPAVTIPLSLIHGIVYITVGLQRVVS